MENRFENPSSPNLKHFIENPAAFSEVMRYNAAGDISYEAWEGKRRFIADAINDDGSVLDIGCAGGFLLKSLQEWSGHNLVPYGIDINETYINEAKRIFPEYPDNFEVLDRSDLSQLPLHGLPQQYDFVYSSVFNLHLDDPENYDISKIVARIKEQIALAKKRFIIGLYAPNQFAFDTAEWKTERERLQERMDELVKSDLGITGSEFNSTQYNQAIAWIDRDMPT